jgi:hypothetical protein
MVIYFITLSFLLTIIGISAYYFGKHKIIEKNKPKWLFYSFLHKQVQAGLNDNGDETNIIVNKLVHEPLDFSNLSDSSDIHAYAKFSIGQLFWRKVYMDKPNELINKLKGKIDIADMDYFDRLMYSKHPLGVPTTKIELLDEVSSTTNFSYSDQSTSENIQKYSRDEVIKIIKDKVIEFAGTKGKKEQALRLGYCLFKTGILGADEDSQQGWLVSFNTFLRDNNAEEYKKGVLLRNPMDDTERRTRESNVKNIEKIISFLQEIGFHEGVDVMKNNMK